VGDPLVTEDQANIEVELSTGQILSGFVKKSLGNVHLPLTNQQLEEKFRDQAVLALGPEQVERVIQLCWRIPELTDANELIQSAIP